MSKSTARMRGAFLLASVSMLTLSGAAVAQTSTASQPQQAGDTIDSGDIVVTATKRSVLLQNVPFSINAQTAQDIQRAHATNLEDLSRNIAGLTIQNLGPGQSQVAIRGVSSGQIARDQPGVQEQVGVYLDESVISMSLFTPDLDLYDLNRVETLRGPQGTLFGAGSEGGTIRYITSQPNATKPEASVEMNYNAVDGGSMGGSVKGMVNVPVTPDLAVRVVGNYTLYPGFIDAVGPNGQLSKNVNEGYRTGGRIAVGWSPTDSISIVPRIVYQKIRTDGFNREDVYNLYANQFTTPSSALGKDQQYLLHPEVFQDDLFIADNTATFKFDGVALTSVSTYTHRKIFVDRDDSTLDGSVSIDLGLAPAAVLLPSSLIDRTRLEQFTQELRVASDNSGPFQWVVGGFYLHNTRDYSQRSVQPGYDAFVDAKLGAGTSAAVANGFEADTPYASEIPYKLREVAAFAEATYDVLPVLHLTAGGRYYDYKESRRFTSGGLFANGDNRTDETKSNGFTPRFLVSWDATSNIKVNAQVSKGFRLGGVNDPLNIPLCSGTDAQVFGNHPDYKDETLWDYEGGIKAHFGRFRVNAAVFYNDISNLQVTADAGSCSSRVIFNVPKAHAEGVEWEFAYTPLHGLDLNLSGTYTHSVLDSTILGSNGSPVAGIRDGNRLPTVPNLQLSAGGTFTRTIDSSKGIDAFFTGSYQYIGSRYTQPGDQEGNPQSFVSNLPFAGASGLDATVLDLRLPKYEIVNVSTGLHLPEQIEVSIYVNNLFDKQALLAFDRERGGRARLAFEVNQPRTAGVTFSKHF
jgi:iron complex outermembrane receptor protein